MDNEEYDIDQENEIIEHYSNNNILVGQPNAKRYFLIGYLFGICLYLLFGIIVCFPDIKRKAKPTKNITNMINNLNKFKR